MNGNEFYSTIRNIDAPCYNDGKDCPKRRVGCRAGCTVWDEYVEQRAAEKRKLEEHYRSRRLVEDFEISSAVRHKERVRRATGRKY